MSTLRQTQLVDSSRWPGGAGMKRRAFCTGLRAIVGLVFSASGLLKIVNQDEFAEALSSYALFSEDVVTLVSSTLPHVEVLLGILYTFGIKTKAVSWVLLTALVVFTSVGAAALLEGRPVDCGCFPIAGLKEPIGVAFFVKNGALAFSCILVALTVGERPGASPLARQRIFS